MAEIEFTIDPTTGQLDVHVKGIRGAACQDVAKLVETLVGTPTVDRNTPEYYLKPQVRPQIPPKALAMREITWIVDQTTGETLLEGIDRKDAASLVGDLLPPPQELFCAVPAILLHLAAASAGEIAQKVCVRIAGYYHNSLIEGPGRRSSVLFQGCPLHCVGCAAENSWAAHGGYLVPVDRLADALLDPAFGRDGISILGGEPMFQPEGLLALVRALRARGCPHLLVYSGYTYERLGRLAQTQPVIGAVLQDVEVLIDGPYIAALADHGDLWTGSSNQRVIDLAATRRTGRLVAVASRGSPSRERAPTSASRHLRQ